MGGWYPVDEERVFAGENGDYSKQLGLSAVVGHETWDQQSGCASNWTAHAGVVYGLCPDTRASPAAPLTQFYAGGEYDMEVQLILRRQFPPASEAPDGEASNWPISWTKSAEFTQDAGEMALELSIQRRRPYGEYIEVDRAAERHHARMLEGAPVCVWRGPIMTGDRAFPDEIIGCQRYGFCRHHTNFGRIRRAWPVNWGAAWTNRDRWARTPHSARRYRGCCGKPDDRSLEFGADRCRALRSRRWCDEELPRLVLM